MIPAIIHQTWKSSDVPARLAAVVASWRVMHPSWEYRFWTDDSLDDFVREAYPDVWPLYRSYPDQIQRVDAARYMLLHHFGGVYADLDVECVRPLDSLRSHAVVLPSTTPLGLSNDFMMSLPRHRVFASLVDALPRSLRRWGHWFVPRHFRILLTTGSLHLTNTVAHAAGKEEVHVLARELYSSQDRSRAYVFHWPGDSWASWDTRFFNSVYAGWRRSVHRSD
jgi:mannosyltransferase OCH1-like enzyme